MCHCDWLWASSASRSASLQILRKIDDSHLLSGSCRSLPLSVIICNRGEARASVIVLARKPCLASKGEQFIAELKAVSCAKAIAGR